MAKNTTSAHSTMTTRLTRSVNANTTGSSCISPRCAMSQMRLIQYSTSGASIYPAVQNIILACRALGLGTVITTNHMLYEDEVKAVLGIPANVATFALMPIGYPTNKYGPVTRKPVAEVTYADTWGTPWKG